MMTPQEISDHKRQWIPRAHTVAIDELLKNKAKEWCKENCEQHQWKLNTWTDVYEHTVMFEHTEHAEQFKEYINKEN